MDKNSLARYKQEPLDLAERAIDLENVLRLYVQGQKGEAGITAMSKQLNLSRAYTKKLVDEAVIVYQNDEGIRARTREVVAEYDLTMDDIKRKSYQLLEDAELANDLKTRATVLKAIADSEAKRVDTLQKSGLLANMDLADQMAEQEARYDALKRIIIDLLKDDPSKRTELARRLSVIEGSAQPAGNVVVVE
jgi:hypothetical protein